MQAHIARSPRASRTLPSISHFSSHLPPSPCRPLGCPGGKSGASAKDAARSVRPQCGVFIGRWRPNSRLEPSLRTRVAVKVMEKDKRTNLDVQHLVSMDFPYVNQFLGEFQSSQQLGVVQGSALTIMVSTYCSGGDHFSALTNPNPSEVSPYEIYLQSQEGGLFCFVNPDRLPEIVNHTMSNVSHVWLPSKHDPQIPVEVFSYIFVGTDATKPTEGIICRVEKVDERSFTLWSSEPPCRFPYDATNPLNASQFSAPFVLRGVQNASCCMLYAVIEWGSAAGSAPTLKKFYKCMPRPNVAFLRAFSVQMLRALGYCHSRKLTAHNGEFVCSCGLWPTSMSVLTFFSLGQISGLSTFSTRIP